jgi:hypothetical protein
MACMDNVGRDCTEFVLGQLLKVVVVEFAAGNWVYTNFELVPSNRLWAIVYGLLYALIQKVGYHGPSRAMA